MVLYYDNSNCGVAELSALVAKSTLAKSTLSMCLEINEALAARLVYRVKQSGFGMIADAGNRGLANGTVLSDMSRDELIDIIRKEMGLDN